MLTVHSRNGLDPMQVGHLKHIDNISLRLPNDWSLMKGKGFDQHDLGGYRFQLAYAAYAIALAHIHRLPAAPGLFKPMFRRLFEKLLLPEVWSYWHDVSRGHSYLNSEVSNQYHEEFDPVRRDNIMYSAYVQSLSLLYNYLFQDDRYAYPGAITFNYFSSFWGGEAKIFRYDQNSLNEHIYWQMAETGFLGVACEPNCTFQICNQPAILGFRIHDFLTGGHRSDEVLESYEAAWKEFGRLDENGHYYRLVLQDKRKPLGNTPLQPWSDAWVGTLMHMWNRAFVRDQYPKQVVALLHEGPSGLLSVRPEPNGPLFGQEVVKDDCDIGWVAAWMSEVGDHDRLERLLGHVDRFMSPTWLHGGLYYPRNDRATDEFGNWTLMEAMSGNTLMAYARLNVSDGLWNLFNNKLPESFYTDPALVDVTSDVEVSRAYFDAGTLKLSMRHRPSTGTGGTAVIGRLPDAAWSLTIDEAEVTTGHGTGVTTNDGIVSRHAYGIALDLPGDARVHDVERRRVQA